MLHVWLFLLKMLPVSLYVSLSLSFKPHLRNQEDKAMSLCVCSNSSKVTNTDKCLAASFQSP